MPDLMSAWDRHYRFTLKSIPQNELLFKGIAFHLKCDQFFHSGAFFKQNNEFTYALCVKHVPKNINCRLFFASHVLVEIILDHCLLNHYPELASRLYAKLSETDYNKIQSVLGSHFNNPLSGFDCHWNNFMKWRFLESYNTLENLKTPLERMLIRAGQASIVHLPSFDEVLMPSYWQILKTAPAWLQEYLEFCKVQTVT